MKKTNKTNRPNVTRRIVVEMIILAIFTGIYAFITQYFMLVPLNIFSVEFWFASIIWLCGICGLLHLMDCINLDFYYDNDDVKMPNFNVPIWVLRALIAFAIVALIIGGFSGSHLFNAKRYASLITVSDGDEESDIPDIETDTLAVVDQKTAEKLGDRQLAYVPNSTFYDVDNNYNLVEIGGEFYRIASINYGGFFKSGKAGSIPAYVQVEAASAGNAQSAKAIMLDTPMVYSPSAYWSHDLGRHLHFNYPNYIFGTSVFEVDDEHVPYWITPVKTPSIGLFGGSLEKSVIVTNAITGECKEYSTSEAPAWIDHIHSIDYMFNLVEYYYKYQGGFWNSVFGKSNVFNTSYDYRSSRTDKDESEFTPFDGYNWVIAKDGKIYAYTGITPANSAETNTGFVLVDSRTCEAKFYEAAGAEESSAQHAAEGLVQDLRYSASFPTIIDINGEFAYFMSLKDNAGLVQRYAICNVKNYSKVVEATTIEKAIAKYNGNRVNSSTDEDVPGTEDDVQVGDIALEGVVSKVEIAEKNGNTNYFFTLVGDKHIYVSSISNSSLQPFKFNKPESELVVVIKCYDSTESGVRIVTDISFK